MRARNDDHLISHFYNAPGARDSFSTFRDRPPLRRSMIVDGQTDLPWLQAELRKLRNENANLRQELKWHSDTILKSEAKARQLLKELGTLKRFAERTELMNPQLSLVLVGLLCRLLDEIGKDPQRIASDLIPEALAVIDHCPFVSYE